MLVVEMVTRVSKEAFYPVPKVDSAILNFRVRDEKPVNVDDEKLFFSCIRAGFGQRRKTLLNSMSAGMNMSKSEMEAIISSAGIDPRRRAETLTMEEFAHISNEFVKRTLNAGK